MKNDISQEYIPYERIRLGSNVISARYLFHVWGTYPFLLGKGTVPLVWLYAYDIKDRQVIPLVEANVSRNYDVVVCPNDDAKEMLVKAYIRMRDEWKTLLHLSYENASEPYIDVLDLVPVGVNIHLDGEGALHVGSYTLSGSVFEGAETVFELG